jgi:hypothetical protein
VLVKNLTDGGGESVGQPAIQGADHEPVIVHRRVPVITAVERRAELPRRQHVCVGVQLLDELMRILPPDCRQRGSSQRLQAGTVQRNHLNAVTSTARALSPARSSRATSTAPGVSQQGRDGQQRVDNPHPQGID